MTKALIREEAIRLRVEERKSLAEIQTATGAAKGTLSAWLRPYPLSQTEVALRVAQRRRSGPPPKFRGDESKHHRALAGRRLTGAEKGRVAEAAVYFRLVLRKFTVRWPAFDGDKVDFLVRAPGGKRWLQLEVRCVKESRKGLPYVKLLCSAGRGKFRRYADDEFDALVGYDLYTDTAYVFPRESIRHLRRCVSIADTYAEAWDALLES